MSALLPPRGQNAGKPNEASLAVSFLVWEITWFVYSPAVQFILIFAKWTQFLFKLPILR